MLDNFLTDDEKSIKECWEYHEQNVSNDEKQETKDIYSYNQKAKSLGYIMRKQGLEYLTRSGYINGDRDRRKH